MGLVRAIGRRLRPLTLHFVVTGVAAFFVLHAVHGEGGLLAYVRLQDELQRVKAKRADLASRRARLEHRVSLLKPDSVHPDMLEEQARRILNFAHPDEAVILRDNSRGPGPPGRSQTARRAP